MRKIFLNDHVYCDLEVLSIYIKRCVSQSVSVSPFVCPWGTNKHFLHTGEEGGETNISHTQEGGETNIFGLRGGQTFLH